jgi:hypothetical protein
VEVLPHRYHDHADPRGLAAQPPARLDQPLQVADDAVEVRADPDPLVGLGRRPVDRSMQIRQAAGDALLPEWKTVPVAGALCHQRKSTWNLNAP